MTIQKLLWLYVYLICLFNFEYFYFRAKVSPSSTLNDGAWYFAVPQYIKDIELNSFGAISFYIYICMAHSSRHYSFSKFTKLHIIIILRDFKRLQEIITFVKKIWKYQFLLNVFVGRQKKNKEYVF